MLILTRKVGEALRIGDNITIMITAIGGGQVKIGIEAPPDVPVNREEIYQRLKQKGENFVRKGNAD